MPTQNIGQVSAFFSGTTPPTNTTLIWLDTSVTPALHKVYDSTIPAWVTVGSLLLDGYELQSNKGIVNGYASLDGSGLVPSNQLPSFVDDVLEFADLASFPVTGETGKIYIALDTGKTYRWSGSVYVEINAGGTPINGTTNNGIVTYINSSSELQVESGLTFDGNGLTVSDDASITGNLDANRLDLVQYLAIENNTFSDKLRLNRDTDTNGTAMGGVTWFNTFTNGTSNNELARIQAYTDGGGSGARGGRIDFSVRNSSADTSTTFLSSDNTGVVNIPISLATDNISSNTTNTDLTLSGDGTGGVYIESDLKFEGMDMTSNSVSGTIVANTIDGSDINSVRIGGGGAISNSRGGFIQLAGNESGLTGVVNISAGNVTGGDIVLSTLSSERVRITRAGDVLVNNLQSIGTDSDLIISGNGTGIVSVDDDLDVVGALSKGSGTFKITHPLDNKKWLYHSFVESPQADNIYRGVVKLVNGTAQIEIDATHNMTFGTFESLNRNIQVFLQNNDGWDLIKGSVVNGILTITSNNPLSNDTIDWLVMGERKDEMVKDWNLTNDEGELIPEWDKE